MSADEGYVSRGGIKLAAALDAFDIRVADLTCADLGCSTGGFTDCLLQRGARHVFAVDTVYGQFAWKLRQDARVTLLERTNALHFDPATLPDFAGCDLVTIDLGWTRQVHAIPAALRWLRMELPDRPPACIISLIKPHYEQQGRRRGVLDDETAASLAQQVLAAMPGLDVAVEGCIPSPIRGGGKAGKGNVEYLALLRCA